MLPYIYPYERNNLVNDPEINTYWESLSDWTTYGTGVGKHINVNYNALIMDWDVDLTWNNTTNDSLRVNYNSGLSNYWVFSTEVNLKHLSKGGLYVSSYPVDFNDVYRFYIDNSKLIVDTNTGGSFVELGDSNFVSVLSLKIIKTAKRLIFSYYNGSDWEVINSVASTGMYSIGLWGAGDLNSSVEFSNTTIGTIDTEYPLVLDSPVDLFINPEDKKIEIHNGILSNYAYLDHTFDRDDGFSVTCNKGGYHFCYDFVADNGYILDISGGVWTLYRIDGGAFTTLYSGDWDYSTIEFGFYNDLIVIWTVDGEYKQLGLIRDNTYTSGKLGLIPLVGAVYSDFESISTYDVKAVPNLLFRHSYCDTIYKNGWLNEQLYSEFEEMINSLNSAESELSNLSTFSDSFSNELTEDIEGLTFFNGHPVINGEYTFTGINKLKELFKNNWKEQYNNNWLLVWEHLTYNTIYDTKCDTQFQMKPTTHYTVGGKRPDKVKTVYFWWLYGVPSRDIENLLLSWNLTQEEVDLIFSYSSEEGVVVYYFDNPSDILQVAEELDLDTYPDSYDSEIDPIEEMDYINNADFTELGDLSKWQPPELENIEDETYIELIEIVNNGYSLLKSIWDLFSNILSVNDWWKDLLKTFSNLNTLQVIDETTELLLNNYADVLDSSLTNFYNFMDKTSLISCIVTKNLEKASEFIDNQLNLYGEELLETNLEVSESLLTLSDNITQVLSFKDNVFNIMDKKFLSNLQYMSMEIPDIVNNLVKSSTCNKLSNQNFNAVMNKLQQKEQEKAREEYIWLKKNVPL